jgi:signal transduction histidine kinase/DNA-binding NarL/FixJ family response regulator
MYFLNTEMHMVTFLITMFEVVMLVLQVIYFLQRPNDKSRLQYLILLMCLITYNVCSGLFTDPRLPIPPAIQTIVSYLVGFTMSMYVVYYFYKVFDLRHLKFFVTYGLILFLFLPFVFLFVVPFLLTGDVRLSGKLTVIIPFFYGLGFIYSTSRALFMKFRTHRQEGRPLDDTLYEHAVVAYISMVCWASLPVIVFFGDFQVLEHSVTNAGFLMMTIIYVRSSIKQSRKEYNQLLESQRGLEDLNKTLKKKVKRRTRKLEKLMEDRKTTFINLAHETKTPLTLINTYLDDYMKSHGDSEEIRCIKKNIQRLTSDIVNFFDVESYEKGFSVYNHDQVSNFSELLSSKIKLFEASAQRKGISIRAMVAESMFVKAHPGAIERIVNNIIENAVKYSESGSEVGVFLESAGGKLQFSVRDQGPGIPNDLHGKVFEPYYKLAVSGRNFEGMGMGLSIVKRIVLDLNGEIQLDSQSGNGTNVTVILPISVQAPTDGEATVISEDDVQFAFNQISLEESITDKNKDTVLVVEDNAEMLNMLIQKLKPKYNVLFARNGLEGLERLEHLTSLDIIISDVMMNDMDGFEFCAAVARKERCSHIPFIFLTAKSNTDDRLKGLQLGAVDYIEKPFHVEELIGKIDSILANLKRQRAAVVKHAYQNLLTDSEVLYRTSVPRKRCAFTDNCKKYRITSREVEIVQLLMKGYPYKIISDQLNISDKTVAKHISNIFLKVGVGNKVELINKLETLELLSDSIS